MPNNRRDFTIGDEYHAKGSRK